jgi:hypothetical protein
MFVCFPLGLDRFFECYFDDSYLCLNRNVPLKVDSTDMTKMS